MYPALPFGPITVPTGPIFAILAVVFALEVASRVGRRFGLRADDVWNTGFLAAIAGVIVARLWNVIQFWYVYSAEPMLIISPRPSGFALVPGLLAALVVAYAYLLRKAIDPVKMAAAFAVGMLGGAALLGVSAYLTGELTGLPAAVPWAMPYFGQMQHPVGLYRAIGFIIALVVAWATALPARPLRTLLIAGLGYGLVHLAVDGFAASAPITGTLRTSQVAGFAIALTCTGLLALEARRAASMTASTA